ncbi:hypothetical protein C0991_003033 [Blastosporella zonata]|nr:hypothetical protein C0991_003033 [Blastosporella zonata]
MSPPRSPDAVYHAISHVLAPEEEEELPSDILELDPDGELDALLAPADPPAVVVDAQLNGSPLRAVFSSYQSVTFTASNFIFLAHATAVSKRRSPSRQIRQTLLWLSALCLLLTFSTYVSIPAGIFFTLTLFVGAAQAALGSYLQTSVVAVASLYGPQALQAMMSGQAAVAVVVSSVQLLSSALFIWKATPEEVSANAIDGQAEKNSARVFFALSTLFLVLSTFANNVLVSKPTYKTLVGPLEQKFVPGIGSLEGAQSLVSHRRDSYTSEKNHIMRVAKANITFELAVAYVFIVTLVGPSAVL